MMALQSSQSSQSSAIFSRPSGQSNQRRMSNGLQSTTGRKNAVIQTWASLPGHSLRRLRHRGREKVPPSSGKKLCRLISRLFGRSPSSARHVSQKATAFTFAKRTQIRAAIRHRWGCLDGLPECHRSAQDLERAERQVEIPVEDSGIRPAGPATLQWSVTLLPVMSVYS